jgi:methionyl-tRNA formyltransferase
MKIAYFGYDFFFGCLDDLSKSNHSILAIFTPDSACDNRRYNFNTMTVDFARRNGIAVYHGKVTHEQIGKLQQDGCDLLVTAAYPFRIPIEACPSLLGVNIHPTLLPVGRGPWPLPEIILRRLTESGVSIHKLEPSFDSGDIILQRSFRLHDNENLESLSCKTQMLARALFSEFLSDPGASLKRARPQDQLGTAEYWPMPDSSKRTLDWTAGIQAVDRVARAFGKFNSFAVYNDCEWIVDDVTVWPAAHGLPPGTLIHKTNREAVVAASDGYVCLRTVEVDPDFKKQ